MTFIYGFIYGLLGKKAYDVYAFSKSDLKSYKAGLFLGFVFWLSFVLLVFSLFTVGMIAVLTSG